MMKHSLSMKDARNSKKMWLALIERVSINKNKTLKVQNNKPQTNVVEATLMGRLTTSSTLMILISLMSLMSTWMRMTKMEKKI